MGINFIPIRVAIKESKLIRRVVKILSQNHCAYELVYVFNMHELILID